MTAAKTATERVQAMRADRAALGLKRLELYAHPDDWPPIKALAAKMTKPRARLARTAPRLPKEPNDGNAA